VSRGASRMCTPSSCNFTLLRPSAAHGMLSENVAMLPDTNSTGALMAALTASGASSRLCSCKPEEEIGSVRCMKHDGDYNSAVIRGRFDAWDVSPQLIPSMQQHAAGQHLGCAHSVRLDLQGSCASTFRASLCAVVLDRLCVYGLHTLL
jgi:hypothetical protein